MATPNTDYELKVSTIKLPLIWLDFRFFEHRKSIVLFEIFFHQYTKNFFEAAVANPL
jgi:hypothetical protein